MRDQLINHRFPVLDHGSITLLDVLGDDQAILRAARLTHQSTSKSDADDHNLLRYLFRHEHATPFECSYLVFHVKLPIFVERQWVRHRAAGLNEASARYSVLPEETYLPDASVVCEQSGSNKQGRGQPMEQYATIFREGCKEVSCVAFDTYHDDLENGVARELARINLPLATYTEKVWWCNLRNLLHFLGLRMDSHAQWEIRQYANIIGNEILAKLFPVTWQAFCDYQLNAITLSAGEIRSIRAVLEDFGLTITDRESSPIANQREYDEMIVKFKKLGIIKE